MLGAGPRPHVALGFALRSLLAASRFSLCASSPSRSIRQGPLSKCPTCHPCSELARDSPAPWERPEQGRRFNCSSEDLCEHGQDRTWTVTLAARLLACPICKIKFTKKPRAARTEATRKSGAKRGGAVLQGAHAHRWLCPFPPGFHRKPPAPTPAAGGPPSSTRIASSRTTGRFCPAVSVHCKSQTDVWPCQTPNEPLSLL